MTIFQRRSFGLCTFVYLSKLKNHLFFMTGQPPVGQDLLIIQASRLRSDIPHSVGLLKTSDQPDAQTSTGQHIHHSQETETHYTGGIRTHNPSNLATADGHLRRRGHWDRPTIDYTHIYYYRPHYMANVNRTTHRPTILREKTNPFCI